MVIPRFLPVLLAGVLLVVPCAAQTTSPRCDEVARTLPQHTNDVVTFYGSIESIEVATGLVIVTMKCLTAQGDSVAGGDFGFVITQFGTTSSMLSSVTQIMRVTGTVREPSFHRLIPNRELTGPWLDDVRMMGCPALPCDTPDPTVTTVTLSAPIPAMDTVAGLTVDAAGNAWVVAGGPTIWRVSADGSVAALPGEVPGAAGIARTSRGTLLVTSRTSGRVIEVLDNGESRTLAEGLEGAAGITVGAEGDIYVAECAANSVTVIADGGRHRLPAPGWFNCPRAVAVGADGRVYVAHGGGVAAIDRNGIAAPHARLPDGGIASVTAVGTQLYATHVDARAVFSVTTSQRAAQRLAGTGAPRAEDGFMPSASFARPAGITVSSDGRWLYVADIEDGRVAIRRIGPLMP